MKKLFKIKNFNFRLFLERKLMLSAIILLLGVKAQAQIVTSTDPITQVKLQYTAVPPATGVDTAVKCWVRVVLSPSDTTNLKKIYVTVNGNTGSFYSQVHNFKTTPVSPSMSTSSNSAVIKTGNTYYVNIGTFIFREDLNYSVKTELMNGTITTAHTFDPYNF